MEAVDELVGAQPLVAGDDARQVDGQETAATDEMRAAKDEQRSGDGEHGIKARGQFHPVDRPGERIAARNTKRRAHAHLQEEAGEYGP